MPVININGNSLDPEAPSPVLRSFGLVQETAQGTDYIVIQTNSPLTKDIKSELLDKKVVIQEKVSDDTYLCQYKPEDLSDIRALNYITYASTYQPYFVVESHLKQVPASSSDAHPLLPEPAPTSYPVLVDVEFHRDVTAGPELAKNIATAAHLDPESLTTEDNKARITVQSQYLSDLAALDPIKSIHKVHPVKLHNNVARTILRADNVVHPTNGTQYQGEGQIVCVADTGFDKGSLNPSQVPADFSNRVNALHSWGRTGTTSDPDGHGTHVCGSVLGDGAAPTMGVPIRGTAPKANLVMQSLLDADGGLGGIPSDLKLLFKQAYDENDARIHTNSWDAGPDPWYQIQYDGNSSEIDEFVDKNRDMVILFAAGNDGMDTKPNDGRVDLAQVMSEAAARNCISVGASENLRPEQKRSYSMFGFPKQPLASDNMANDAEGMAAFSSRGPTAEGLIKPDLVAPGTCILSNRSSHLGVTDGQRWGVSTDRRYMYQGGTSMATPLIAGCCAVLRETLVKNDTPNPSAALIKALLINGAVELKGQYTPTEAGRSPNFASGWGRVDLANSVVMPGSPTVRADETKVTADGTAGFRDEASEGLDTAEEFKFTISIKDIPGGHQQSETDVPDKAFPCRTLKVTLVWTDPPGRGLQNDLDLIVRPLDGQMERHGNRGTKNFPRDKAALAAAQINEPYDRTNNVEQVVWEGVPLRDMEVVVRGYNIILRNAQTFALAWKVYP